MYSSTYHGHFMEVTLWGAHETSSFKIRFHPRAQTLSVCVRHLYQYHTPNHCMLVFNCIIWIAYTAKPAPRPYCFQVWFSSEALQDVSRSEGYWTLQSFMPFLSSGHPVTSLCSQSPTRKARHSSQALLSPCKFSIWQESCLTNHSQIVPVLLHSCISAGGPLHSFNAHFNQA